MTNENLPPRPLKTPSAAEYIGVHPGTMRRWRSEGTGPTYCTVNGRVRYYLKDLDAWLRSGEVSNEASR